MEEELKKELKEAKKRYESALERGAKDTEVHDLSASIYECIKALREFRSQKFSAAAFKVVASDKQKPKTITLTFPAPKGEEMLIYEVTVDDQESFKDQMFLNKCTFFKSGDLTAAVTKFEDLQENVVYVGVSPWSNAIMDERTHRQVEAKVLEVEVGLAVKNAIGARSHIHMNYKFSNEVEIDGIVVHDGGETVDDSVAYIIECGYNPNVPKVDQIFKKMETFKKFAPMDQHFRKVKSIVPIFGARLFSPVASQYCKDKNIWQVFPGGNGYSLIRNFTTCMLRRR